MKLIYMIVALSLLALPVFSQEDFGAPTSKIYPGYNGIPWGSTVSQIKAVYPNVRNAGRQDGDFKAGTIGIERYNSGDIETREFVVLRGGLVKVIVTYNFHKIDASSLADRLKEKFGHDYQSSQTGSGENMEGIVRWEDAKTVVAFRLGMIEGEPYCILMYLDKVAYNSANPAVAPSW